MGFLFTLLVSAKFSRKMSVQDFHNALKRKVFGIAETMTPILTESKFREKGVLTPDEFIQAGDQLVHHCSTWRWQSGDESMAKDFLPRDKQFLISRGLPCRVRQAATQKMVEQIIHTENGTDFVSFDDVSGNADEEVADLLDSEVSAKGVADDNVDDDDDDDDEEAVDMDEFLEAGLADDSLLVQKKPTEAASRQTVPELERLRTYDLHITYDKLYQTPRLWLVGYDEQKSLLTPEQMNEDISQDHANKTVTLEAHPNLPGPPRASVHPCRHAETVKRFVEGLDEKEQVNVNQYLIIFLKFMQAIIPGVEYDFTQDVTMR